MTIFWILVLIVGIGIGFLGNRVGEDPHNSDSAHVLGALAEVFGVVICAVAIVILIS